MDSIDPQIELLIDAYIDYSIDDGQFESLCGWLLEDDEHRKAFARKLALHSEIAEWCIERSGGDLAGSFGTVEAEAELLTVQYTGPDRLTKQKYVSALSYVLSHTFTPKRVAVLATAAGLLVGAVIAILFLIDSRDVAEPIVGAGDPPPVDQAPIDVRHVVATLTNEQDAVWDRRPGQDLYAGQRFTLNQGFAEVTTTRGAIAILEAPATIELLDHNAIRLHTGLLVGICETESSKGFLIRTPHSDVTDLGTVFGVDCRNTGTTVSVFEGEARVEREHGVVKRLAQGDAVSMPAGSSELRPIASQSALFPTSWEQVDRGVQIQGMGVGLFAPPASIRSEAFENDGRITVFQERQAIELRQDQPVCLDKPGQWARFPDATARPIPASTSVDSYMIHFDPVGQPKEVVRATAEMTFDRPIIGIIVRPELLRKTDKVLGHSSVEYPVNLAANSGIEGLELADRFPETTNINTLDVVQISPDRRTLRIALFSNLHVDQIRVMTEASGTRP
ncbi:MAG: FecR domain-containing protein [Planctomycetota bacterium]